MTKATARTKSQSGVFYQAQRGMSLFERIGQRQGNDGTNPYKSFNMRPFKSIMQFEVALVSGQIYHYFWNMS